MNYILSIILIIGIIATAIYIANQKKSIQHLDLVSGDMLLTNAEMNKTLAIGIYNRFKQEEGKEETPLDFETFVATIFRNLYDCETFVTQASGDFGVDIEQNREDGLYLGQVKCYNHPVGFEPIAIIHSQMIKRKATGGFVVTTSNYTENAKWYAQGLGIELVDGDMLVKYWNDSVNNKVIDIKAIVNPI